MGLIKEFKDFAMRGSVVDMAVGIIIGGAFGKIVSSVVNDVVMPPIGLLTGGVDFSDKKLVLKEAVAANPAEGIKEAAAITLNYGSFISTVIDFLIVAFAIFMMIRAMNRATALVKKKDEAPAAPTTKECPQCCSTVPINAVRCAYCTSPIAITT